MKKVLFILLILVGCFSYKAFCYDETFEEYDTSEGAAKLVNYWGVNEKDNADGTGRVGVSEDSDGNNALHLNIVSNRNDNKWFDSYAEITNLNGSDKFMVKARIKVTRGSTGVLELFLRTGSGPSGGLYFARSSDGKIEILPGIASPAKTVTVSENVYYDIAVLLDRENDVIIAYSEGEELARRTGYIKGTNQDNFVFEDSKLRFCATFQDKQRPQGATLDAYVDDIIFQDNISQTDGIFFAPVSYKSVFADGDADGEHDLYYVGGQVGASSVKVRVNIMNLLAPRPMALVSAAFSGDSVSQLAIDNNNTNPAPTGEMITLETTLTEVGEDITEFKSFVFNGLEDISPMITVAEPTEMASPFPGNDLGQGFLKDRFAVHETSGLLYYNNSKVIPEYYPFPEDDKLYVHVSNLSEAFDMDIQHDATEWMSMAKQKDGQWYLPIKQFYNVAFVSNPVGYLEEEKLFIIGVQTGSDDEIKDATEFMRFERPSLTEVRRLIKENLSEGARPRILINQDDLIRIKGYYTSADLEAIKMVKDPINNAITESGKIISREVSKYEKSDGLRLLEVSREVLRRLENLSISYLMSENQADRDEYAERAWKEIEAVCAFPDWNALNHFLDSGEMMAAFAVAYDWLHDYLNENQKALMRDKMMKYGIIPTYNVHRKIAKTSNFWRDDIYNWNAVCNGGAVMAALAIVDDMEDKSVCIDVITNAIRSLEYMMPTFDPDGAWPEGPSYWSYTTMYLTRMISTLDSALGRDFGMMRVDGLKKTAEFIAYSHGALEKDSVFNYHDAWVGNINASQLTWLARKFKDSHIAGLRAAAIELYSDVKPAIFDALWYDASLDNSPSALPLSDMFRGDAEMFAHRSSWGKNAVYLASQGGYVNLNHAHWDNGSFVFDADGYRWAADIGTDSYNLGIPSNQIYRMRAEAHNTIVINPDESLGQDSDAFTPITAFESNDNAGFGVIDLTEAYKQHAGSVIRGLGLFDNRSKAVIRDEITLNAKDGGNTVYWFMTTPWTTSTEITHDVNKNQFIIKNGPSGNQKTMYLKYKVDGDAQVAADFGAAEGLSESNIPESPKQADNKDYRRLHIKLTEATGDIKITVVLTSDEHAKIMDKNIANWSITESYPQ